MGKLRIKSEREVRRALGQVLESLKDGPVFVARDRRVRAVLLDISDYYDLVDEIRDLVGLLHSMGGCDCGCGEEADRLLDEALGEAGD